ncbi:hypothetical protein EJ04DRAFT_523671 [Polyplosphaeria fusca]|uniref:Uncharacterized protein n=1 Tax=Polyplosphaeria fusca TaxID=682080 RepID=A0A9P4QVE1_9PLEO|nr:hypothetical protein EJ04DRAFT_523671 [Polyplosphaeria fusca]
MTRFMLLSLSSGLSMAFPVAQQQSPDTVCTDLHNRTAGLPAPSPPEPLFHARKEQPSLQSGEEFSARDTSRGRRGPHEKASARHVTENCGASRRDNTTYKVSGE